MSAIGAAVRRSGVWGSSPTRRDRSARQVTCRLHTSPFSLKFLPNFSTPARRSKICDKAQIFENYADDIFYIPSCLLPPALLSAYSAFSAGNGRATRGAQKRRARAPVFFVRPRFCLAVLFPAEICYLRLTDAARGARGVFGCVFSRPHPFRPFLRPFFRYSVGALPCGFPAAPVENAARCISLILPRFFRRLQQKIKLIVDFLPPVEYNKSTRKGILAYTRAA